jgi:TusA-related sulfurtransferase/uncharacterized coiled-coil protein SlyX
MTFNNSVLLILKNNQGIDFNELFLRISSRYTNKNSARASLLRALKNLESLGQIQRKNSRIYITDKGLATIKIDMKEQFVLKLNEAFKKPVENVDEIVQLLIVLGERASEGGDLLNISKEHAEFTIKDISDLQDKITEQQEHLEKMRALLGMQEERFRELNFIDQKTFSFDKEFLRKIKKLINEEKLIVETNDSDFLNQIPELLVKENNIIVEKEFEDKFFEILLNNPLTEMTIYLNGIKIIVRKATAFCFGDFEKLKNIK